jgi:hypothetical protein
VLDLEREEVDGMEGMTPELADKLMAFLTELTEDGGEEEPTGGTPPPATGAGGEAAPA